MKISESDTSLDGGALLLSRLRSCSSWMLNCLNTFVSMFDIEALRLSRFLSNLMSRRL